MSDFRKKLLLAAGYFGFFLAAFLVFLYLTFDAGIIFKVVQEAAASAGVELEAGEVSLHRLVGMEFKNLSVTVKSNNPDIQDMNLKIDRLSITPSISSLPGALSAVRAGKDPDITFSFEALMGGGKVEGTVIQKPPGIELAGLEIKSLPLGRLPVASPGLEDFQLSGLLDGKIKSLDLADVRQPRSWKGDLQLDLKAPSVTDFKWNGIALPGISMQGGTFKAQIKDGEADVSALKLIGDDLPTNLQGKISLRTPLTKSLLDLNGSFKVSDEIWDKSPVISVSIPTKEATHVGGSLDYPTLSK